MSVSMSRSTFFEMIEDEDGDYLSLKCANLQIWDSHYRILMKIHEDVMNNIDYPNDWTLLDTIGMIIAKGIYYSNPARWEDRK